VPFGSAHFSVEADLVVQSPELIHQQLLLLEFLPVFRVPRPHQDVEISSGSGHVADTKGRISINGILPGFLTADAGVEMNTEAT
jgi:hypothetical protein